LSVKSLKRALRIVVLLILMGLIFHGIRLGDFEETKVNGSMLCLSCIGIE
jgi:hypothetical protein